MTKAHSSANPHQAKQSTYLIGFGLSLILTLMAYVAVQQQILSGQTLIISILALAVIQMVIQLWFFLHLGREDKPYWNTIFLLNTIAIIMIVVIGSVWIVGNLSYRMMSPQEMDQYMIEQGDKGF